MVQILLMLEVLFTQDSEVEDLFCDASKSTVSYKCILFEDITYFCLACTAEVRHMYCFSGVVVIAIFIIGGGNINCFRVFTFR